MTNFSDVVTVFKSCLVEVINYEGVNLIQNSDMKVPLIFIRSVILRVHRPDGEIVDIFYPHEYASRQEREAFNTTKNWKILTPYKDIAARTKHQWKCFARLFLLPPMPDLKNMRPEVRTHMDDSNFYRIFNKYHEKCGSWTDSELQHIYGSQNHWNFNTVTPFDYPFQSSAPKYYILIHRSGYKWEYTLSIFWGPYALEAQITGIVITLTDSLDNIKSAELLCTNCPAIKKTELKFAPGVKFDIESLKCRNDLDCGTEIPIRFRMWGKIREDLQGNANRILRLGYKFSLVDLLREMFDADIAIEIGLLSIGIGKEAGNLSFIFNDDYDNESSCGELKMVDRMPVFSLWVDWFLLSKGSRETLSFVTCGGSSTSTVNFSGFTSSFDFHTWISIFTVIALFSTLFTTIYTLRTKTPLTGVRISLEMSIRALLEQGDHITESNKRFQTFINYILCPWILTAIVLTNAYKGKNITDLTSPLRLEGITNFSQFKTHPVNFTIYTKNIAFIERTSREDCEDVYHALFDMRVNGVQVIEESEAKNRFGEFHSIVRESDPYDLSDLNIMTLLKPELRKLFRKDLHRKVQVYPDCHLFRFSNFTFFNVLKNCAENVAAFVWSSEADEIEAKLKQYLGRRGKLKISRGEEPLIFKRKGWKLRGPGRIEAGVVDELRKLGKIKGEKIDEIIANENDLKGLSTQGNITAVFALWGICLAGAALMGVIEGRSLLLLGATRCLGFVKNAGKKGLRWLRKWCRRERFQVKG
ncbi:hypothetical protein Fcan01_17021 [Folsomia candida]|uniref:Uncharacterized protein n=1 Tax=Folsomia candida TaxID=158441 RepID=A0A226DR00_FOLCA|nr:hypothetical protein Fcan01_17021 [Folsomia candida]